MKVLGVTLARGGSKGIPKKNIREVAGKPLIAWTIEAALQSKHLTNYIVSTDDQEIAAVSREYGATVLMRPAELAQDDTPSLYPLVHAALGYKDHAIIADIRCTNPLKTTEDIDGAIDLMLDKDVTSVIGVSPATPPERIKRVWGGLIVDTFPEPRDGQRQFLPKYYVRNGSIYVIQTSALYFYNPEKGEVEGWGQLFGHVDSLAYVMPKERSVNIDDEIDMKLADLLLRERMQG